MTTHALSTLVPDIIQDLLKIIIAPSPPQLRVWSRRGNRVCEPVGFEVHCRSSAAVTVEKRVRDLRFPVLAYYKQILFRPVTGGGEGPATSSLNGSEVGND